MSYNPFEVPQSIEPPVIEPLAGQPALASRSQRLLGAFVDGILMSIISFAISAAMGLSPLLTPNVKISFGGQMLQSILGLVAFLLVHGYLLFTQGQTVGKWLLGTRIVDARTGQLLPFTRVYIIRYLWLTPLVLLIPFLPPGLVVLLGSIVGFINIGDSLLIFGKDCRCLHDYLAGSIVVPARQQPPARPAQGI